jgi:bifunctional non-homologous end joining protein LigD
VIDPGSGTTKGDLAAYMAEVAERMVPHVAGRPLMLLRCPDGAHRGCFFQKHPSTPVPPALATVSVMESNGRRPYLSVRSPAGLVSLVQMGAIEVHVWGSRADREDRPDRVVFDLDPDPSVPWTETVRTAHSIRERLEELGLESFAKTTGGKGIHVVAPIRRGPDWNAVADFSGAIASEIVRADPARFTTQLAKAKRRRRILIDTLRNRRGATWVEPYSPRARDGVTVSTPVAWSELTSSLAPGRLTVATVPKRLHGSDPWAGMERVTQTITATMLREIARNTARPRV